MSDSYPPFTQQSVTRMLAFLPLFEAGEFREVADEYMASGQNPATVDHLASEVYRSGFVFPFDWSKWPEGRTARSIEGITSADMPTLRKLMTVLVRNDRFCGGSLAKSCADGTIEQILRRLRELADGVKATTHFSN